MSGDGPGLACAPRGPRSSSRPAGRPSRRQSWAAATEKALREASYEVLPLRNAEQAVVEHVPQDVPREPDERRPDGDGGTAEGN